MGNTSSPKLMRSTSSGGLLCTPGTGGLAEGPSLSDLNALAWDTTGSRGGTVTGFSKAAPQVGFSEETDFLGSGGRGAGIGTIFPLAGLSATGPPPRISGLTFRIRPGFGFFGNSGLVTGTLPASLRGKCGVSPSLEATLSLFSFQESNSPEALLAAGLGATECFPEETVDRGRSARGAISGFLGSPEVSVLV